MKYLPPALREWTQDRLLRRVVRNTGYLFSSNTISMVLTSFQGILAALLLGPADYGMLGIITMFASTVNRLLSFRMGELVVKYAGQYLALERKDQAAAVIKAAGLTEAVTSVVAYALLVLLAPLAAIYIVKDPTKTGWITFYGLALLANLITETSTAVLQVSNHYRTQAVLNLAQSILTAGWILVAFLTKGDIYQVLLAYLAGKLLFGLGIMAAALYWLKPLLGAGWWKVSFRRASGWREMAGFAVSTNLSGTINMVIRDSEVLWVGFFLTSVQAGYYKFALAVMNIILLPITPFISTTYPEISKSVARQEWQPLRSLLRRTTLMAAAWTLGCAAGVLLVGQWFLGLLKHGEYLPSFPAILVLLIGYGVANVFFWNRPLLLALGHPNFPLGVTFAVGVVKTGLMFVLVHPLGYLAQAGLLSGYFVISVGVIVWRGLKETRRAERAALADTVAL